MVVSQNPHDQIGANCKSYACIARTVGMRLQGSNYRTIKRRISRQQLSTSHFSPYAARPKTPAAPLERILIIGSKYSSNDTKKRLYKEGILKPVCSKCGLGPEWQGSPLSLQLDHINGIRDDNRLENLRILCPNCHTQTSTHSGTRLSPQMLLNRYKITKEELEKLIWSKSLVQAGIQLGVTDNAVKKWCRYLGIALPPQGYWARRNAGHSHEIALSGLNYIPKYTHLSQEERNKIRLMLTEGLTFREIGNRLNRCHTTVSRWVSQNSGA